MINILFYSANILNYIRFLLLIIAFGNMKRSSFLTCILILISGGINILDGQLARYLNETSQFGAALDSFLDRLTTTFIYFFICSIYPKYWSLLANVGFIELMSDSLNNYKNTILLKYDIKSDNNSIKSCLDPCSIHFLRLVWFSSDLFYLLIYIGSFLAKNNNNHKELSDLFNNNKKSTFIVHDYLQICNKKMNNNLRFIFKTISFICLFGAVGKYLMNLNSCVSSLNEIIQMDIILNK
jgi:hypothetical protein